MRQAKSQTLPEARCATLQDVDADRCVMIDHRRATLEAAGMEQGTTEQIQCLRLMEQSLDKLTQAQLLSQTFELCTHTDAGLAFDIPGEKTYGAASQGSGQEPCVRSRWRLFYQTSMFSELSHTHCGCSMLAGDWRSSRVDRDVGACCLKLAKTIG